MSYILDALKKSEQERRQHAAAPDLSSIHQASDAQEQPSALRFLVWTLLVLLLVIGAWGGYLVQHTNDAAPANTSSAAPTASTQPAIPDSRRRNGTTVDQSQAQALYKHEAGEKDIKVTRLYSEPEVANTPETKPRQAQKTPDTNRLPNIRELPLSVQSQIGPMDYSAHVYSSDVSRGFAIINGKRRYREDRMENGATVVTVLEEAVVLEFMGQLFTLDAMQSWPE